MVDAHLHLVNFLLQGPSPHEVISGLDRAGVGRAVVFGMAVKKKWAIYEPLEPSYYLDDNAPCIYYSLADQIVADLVLELPPEQQRRLAPLVCGFDPTDRFAVVDLERMWNKYPFWRGVGELLLRHDDLTNLTQGETARINHPALDEVLAFCREHDCPISVHQDHSSPGRPRVREYVGEMTETLDRHPGTNVVWCHAGGDRRLDPHQVAGFVGEMLDRYASLHIDISWVLFDRAVCPDGLPNPEWVTLIGRHSDRFVIGSDAVGDMERQASSMNGFVPLLDALDATAREHVSHINAERLWFDV